MILYYKQESKYFSTLWETDIVQFEKDCNPEEADDNTLTFRPRMLRVIFYSIQEKQQQISLLEKMIDANILSASINHNLREIQNGLVEETKSLNYISRKH